MDVIPLPGLIGEHSELNECCSQPVIQQFLKVHILFFCKFTYEVVHIRLKINRETVCRVRAIKFTAVAFRKIVFSLHNVQNSKIPNSIYSSAFSINSWMRGSMEAGSGCRPSMSRALS